MISEWKILIDEQAQSSNITSFIGGKPHLPKGVEIPRCQLCGAEQAFIFQLAFPEGHLWHGSSLAVFYCILCMDENYIIPEMLTGELKGINIPKDFLSKYQRNFKIITFDTCEAQEKSDYHIKVNYQPIKFCRDDVDTQAIGKLGGDPHWLLDNESPGKYNDDYELNFLFQLNQDIEFPISKDAPHQMELNLFGEIEESSLSYYQIFNGNNMYFFGVLNHDPQLVYLITQI